MPNFKPKTNKKIISDSKSLVTLDNKHNELLEKFNVFKKSRYLISFFHSAPA